MKNKGGPLYLNTLEKSQVFLAGTVLARRGGIRPSGPGRRPCDRHALDVSADRPCRMRRHISFGRRFVHARPDCRQQRYHRRKQRKAAACAEPSRDASAKDRCAGAITRVCTGSPLTRSSIEESVAKNQMPAKYGHLDFLCVSRAPSARRSFRVPAHMEFLPRSAPSASFFGSGFWARTRWQEAFFRCSRRARHVP